MSMAMQSFAVDKGIAMTSHDLRISIIALKENLQVIHVYKVILGSRNKQTQKILMIS